MAYKVIVACLILILCGVEVLSQVNYPILNLLEKSVPNTIQNEQCVDTISLLLNGSLHRWGIQMLDSTGKLQSGILAGNIMNLGDYDQCITIRDKKAGVRGKYCLMTYHVQADISSLQGVCLPEVCNLGGLTPSNKFHVREDLCQTNDVDLDSGDVFCIILMTCSVFWMMFATWYDLHTRKVESTDINQTIVAFSIYTNTIKLCKNSPSEISCLYGIRVLSMLWIMYANCASIMTSIPATNSNDLLSQKFSDKSNYIYGASFAVDTFFYLSGFMLAYNAIKNKRSKISHVPRYFVHRWMRILPSLAVLILIILTISRRVGSGPIYQHAVEIARQPCVRHWLSYFLFLQNYANPENLCLPHTWYLSADMQMHIISPFILLPLGKLIVTGKTWLIGLMFIGLMGKYILFSTLIIIYDENVNVYATHWRMTIFLIGIFAGSKATSLDTFVKKLKKIISCIIWVVTLTTMAAIAHQARYILQEPNTMYAINLATFGRPVWGACLTWIIFNCMTGRSELVNKFLSHLIFEVVSRLCFAMYVLSNLEIAYHVYTARNSIYLDHVVLWQTWVSDVFITMFFAYVWSMLFEVPVIHIDKIHFGFGTRSNIDDSKEYRKFNSLENV